MNRIRLFCGIAAVGLVAALGACSPSAEKAEAPPAAEAPAPAAPAATEPAPQPIELAITDASGAKLSGDPVAGKRVFAQCATCHSVNAGENRVGPSLHNIIGREAGEVEGFRYSEANKNSHLVWSEQELFTYLENPRAKIPGTTMAFVGLRNPQQRADVIAYLKTASQ